MKTSGKCPKCNGTNIYTNKNNNIYSSGRHEIAGGSGMSKLRIDTYACIDCGFIEEYVCQDSLHHEKKMRKMTERWDKVV